jgi:hypothetical protein
MVQAKVRFHPKQTVCKEMEMSEEKHGYIEVIRVASGPIDR